MIPTDNPKGTRRQFLLATGAAALAAGCAGASQAGKESQVTGAPADSGVRPAPGGAWPDVFELNSGESRTVSRAGVERTIRLLSVEESWQPDYWIGSNRDRKTLREARIALEVSGERVTLIARPYQMPVTVAGLRLYVEATRTWATQCDYDQALPVTGEVRLSATAAGETWGPTDMVFPIRNYRWRSGTYNNTWLALVPYNRLYYHRGEDFGAIPDRLEVAAPLSGEIAASPLPSGDGKSNSLAIRHASGAEVRLAHMNIETIDPHLTVGAHVEAGQAVGKTGCTWSGKRSQMSDPHLHVGLQVAGAVVSLYPAIVEAYLRAYGDAILAVAGGYHFAVPGDAVALDSSRSAARPGRKIAAFSWRLHDGSAAAGPLARIRYDRPGLYSEELIVRTDDGAEDRDFAQVRIFDPARGNRIAYGWAYHSPVRGARPGDDVLFWNRLMGVTGPVKIDFGDGSPPQEIKAETRHAYARPGMHTVALTSRGPDDEPATIKMRVVVEP